MDALTGDLRKRILALTDHQRGWMLALILHGITEETLDGWVLAGADTPGFFDKGKRDVYDCLQDSKIHSLFPVIHKINGHKYRSSSSFVVPSAEEVKTYCEERRNSIDPEQFVDFYTARGWKIGKVPMKDWRAAVRTWEKNQPKSESRCTKPGHVGLTNTGRCWVCVYGESK